MFLQVYSNLLSILGYICIWAQVAYGKLDHKRSLEVMSPIPRVHHL